MMVKCRWKSRKWEIICGLKSVAVEESAWDEDDWESRSTEGRFDLCIKDGGHDFINDGCKKHDDDNNDDDLGHNTSSNVLIINLENLMFLFSVRWRWSLYSIVACLKSCLANSSLGLGSGKLPVGIQKNANKIYFSIY